MLRIETRQPAEAWDNALRRLYATQACTVRLTAEASDAFEREQRALQSFGQAFADSHPPLASHLAKRPAMLARLALAFHALEAPAIGADLAAATMHKAARFLRRQERHALAIYTGMLGSDTGMALARDVARSILASCLQSFNRRELVPRCKAFRHAEAPTRHAALTLLADYGWIETDLGVAHGARWAVDPRVHALFAEHGKAARQRRAQIRARITEGDDDE